MAANVFINGGMDPLLGSNPSSFQPDPNQLSYINDLQQKLEAYKQAMQQAPVPGQQPAVQQPVPVQPSASRSPVWDEIEQITNELSEREFDLITSDESFKESQNAITVILTREQMRMMRPIVEGTKDGREALESHLLLLKKLRKQAKKEADRNLELFNEYTEHYSDMPYAEFLKTKRGGGKPTKK